VPEGAVTASLAFTIQQVDSPRSGAVGQVFEIGPSGVTFGQPITLVFHYRTADLGDNPPQALRVATLGRRGWQSVPSTVDVPGGLATGQITHFSPWTLVLDPGRPGGDPDGGDLGGFDAGGSDAGGSDAGGSLAAVDARMDAGAADARAVDAGAADTGAADAATTE
jgi:hypothetical protein